MQIIRGHEMEFTPASHEDPQDPGVWKRVLASKFDLLVGQVQMVNWARLPAGKAFRRHYHEDMQEMFVFVDQTVQVRVDGVSAELHRGDAVLIDPREVHEMSNPGKEDAHYVVFGISTGQSGKTVVCDG